MERIARHFLANPTRKNQLLALVLKLDFGNNDPAIRTRTLRSLYAAIKPSRSLTLPTANCLHSSLLTKNLRSIPTGAWCSCSFGRPDFSRTDIHRIYYTPLGPTMAP